MPKATRGRATLVVAAASLAVLPIAATASANTGDHRTEKYRADLRPVPHASSADSGSNVTGQVKLKLRGDNALQVRLKARRTSANLPHAVHIHGKDNPEVAQCPGADRRDDLVDDGLIETAEGLGDYGPVLISFTTTGDTSADSLLALDRFPVASDSGRLRYKRTFDIPTDLAGRLDDFHVVVHGEDLNHDGMYGGRTTALGAPLEAELPVACGELHRRGH